MIIIVPASKPPIRSILPHHMLKDLWALVAAKVWVLHRFHPR
jgi:hypothetical protein